MLALLCMLALACFASPSCLGDNGEGVDFFVALKQPRHPAYLFSSTNASLVLSPHTVSEPNSAIGASVGQTQDAPSVLMWNDQPPGAAVSMSVAHDKGILVFDQSGGFVLMHSVPNFPPPPGGAYSYPATGLFYGQSFLCISLDAGNVTTVLQGLGIINAGVYFNRNGPALSVPTVSTATELGVISRRGVTFRLFVKNKEWNDVLYDTLVAQALRSDLACETWTNGPAGDTIGSACATGAGHSVYNVASLSFAQQRMHWLRASDHSKWCIGERGWLCIGGINRQVSQNHRGGLTCCTQALSGLQASFASAVATVNVCGSTISSASVPASLRLESESGAVTLAALAALVLIPVAIAVSLYCYCRSKTVAAVAELQEPLLPARTSARRRSVSPPPAGLRRASLRTSVHITV
jgi:deoxyribonuclease-2